MDLVEPFSEQVERLFHEALEIDEGSRCIFLASACGGDETLRLAVARLLDASGRVYRKPAWNELAIEHEARLAAGSDSTLDRYRLMECIGAGGMGRVYKAVRADDAFSKVVAIKILHHLAGEAGGETGVRRFRQERQILARLEHPNITRLLDGGSTPEGLPFLVMDFVEGLPVDEYLAGKKLPVGQVLELFQKICSAVSYAHRNLVVHRDLKPGNILVTADGTPKLLDFGIAKLLDGPAEHTLTGAAMTREYASPEQLRGAAVTTATDVYSLGVLLYEMLAGAPPYRETSGPMELAQAICSQIPQTLSARTGRRFDRDLENIVQMALRKEPERRYTSVEHFSEDLRRYVEGYPVTARAVTGRYRAYKFIGRNKSLIAAGALVLLTLLGGIAATAREAQLANRRFNDVRKLANSFLFEVHDAIRDLPGSTPARQLVVKRGIEYLDSLAGERGGDRQLARELASAYEKVGDVLGAPYWPSLGDHMGALASYRKALAIREPLAAASLENVELGTELVRNYVKVGLLIQQGGDLQGAAAAERKGVLVGDALAARHPSFVPLLGQLAAAYEILGNITGNYRGPNLGDANGALQLLERGLQLRERIALEAPANGEERLFLGAAFSRIGAVEQGLDHKEESIARYRQALRIEDDLIGKDRLNVMYRKQAAADCRAFALVLVHAGQSAEAGKWEDRSVHLFEELAREDPANMEAQEALADSRSTQGYFEMQANRPVQAVHYYDSAFAIYATVMAKHAGYLPVELGSVYGLAADLGIQTGDTSKALWYAQKELENAQELLRANAGNANALQIEGRAYTQIGHIHELLASSRRAPAARRLAEWREAQAWYQRGLDVWTDQKKRGALIPIYAFEMDEGARNAERCERAIRLLSLS